MMLLAIIGMSLFGGFWISGLVIGAVIVWGIIFYPENGQFPLLGVAFAPFTFVIGTFLTGLCLFKLVRTLPAWGLVGYGLFLFLLLPLAFFLFPLR